MVVDRLEQVPDPDPIQDREVLLADLRDLLRRVGLEKVRDQAQSDGRLAGPVAQRCRRLEHLACAGQRYVVLLEGVAQVEQDEFHGSAFRATDER